MITGIWKNERYSASRECLTPKSWEDFKFLCHSAGLPRVLYNYLDKKGEAYLSGALTLLLVAEKAHERAFDNTVPPILSWEAEFPVRRGRADFMLYHDDGSATVVELKDGSYGVQSLLAGIGQVIGYAMQIGMNNPGISCLRKALVFSSCGTVEDDQLIIDACEHAGVIPIPFGAERAFRKATMDHLMGVLESAFLPREVMQHVLF
jgi:hypothetical protein